MAISDISANALKVLEKRYLEKDKDGNCIEDVEGLFQRVAAAVAAAMAIGLKARDLQGEAAPEPEILFL